MIKAWATSDKYGPHALPWFVKDALSSVAGYVVALITKTLPQALWYGTHKIHVDVTTTDKDTLWVDHRRGDFSELAVATNSDKSTTTSTTQQQHMIYSGTTGIIAGKSALVLFCHVNSCVQCDASMIWLLHLTFNCIYLLTLQTMCTNRSYNLLSSSS